MQTYQVSAIRKHSSLIVMTVKANNPQEALEKGKDWEYEDLDESDEENEYTDWQVE